MGDSANHTTLDKTTLVAALLLATPPVLALTAAAFPGAVPIPFVQVDDPASMRPLLILVGIGLIVVNALFLVLLRRYLGEHGE